MRFFSFLLIIFFIINPCFAANNPRLIVKTFNGEHFDLNRQKGQIVIVNFWASWCSVCRKEIFILDKIYKKYRQKNLVVIGISVDEKKFRHNALKIADKLSYPNAFFEESLISDFEEPDSIPLPYIIGKDGKIIDKLDREDIELNEKFFDEILKDLLHTK